MVVTEGILLEEEGLVRHFLALLHFLMEQMGVREDSEEAVEERVIELQPKPLGLVEQVVLELEEVEEVMVLEVLPGPSGELVRTGVYPIIRGAVPAVAVVSAVVFL